MEKTLNQFMHINGAKLCNHEIVLQYQFTVYKFIEVWHTFDFTRIFLIMNHLEEFYDKALQLQALLFVACYYSTHNMYVNRFHYPHGWSITQIKTTCHSKVLRVLIHQLKLIKTHLLYKRYKYSLMFYI